MKGMLSINLDPPSLSFEPANSSGSDHCHRECSKSELNSFLKLLTLRETTTGTMPKDLVVRSYGQFSPETLIRLGLLPKDSRVAITQSE